MERAEKMDILRDAYQHCIRLGMVKTKAEFADLVGINQSSLSSAMNGDERYLTDRLIAKVIKVAETPAPDTSSSPTIPVIPYGARGGNLTDFSDAIHEYDCERIISPIRGAQLAMDVTGDSMSPDYPSGSRIILKKVHEDIFLAWGEVYVLDTIDGPILKRIFPTDDPEVIECRSINPAYAPFKIKKENVVGWWRVLMLLAMK